MDLPLLSPKFHATGSGVAQGLTGMPGTLAFGRHRKQVTLAGPAGTIVQTTPLRPERKTIYQALPITPPPRMSAFEPN